MNREKREPEYPIELESQFILRLPEEPAKILRELLQSGENFKNRLSIKLDPDMRHGEVRFDHWLLYGRIMDLPTIVESLKTIDRKSVYKTADICQIMICKTEIDPKSEDESQVKNKKKDPHKVDKKFLWPHGITPPTKNVRKRRFRKTLKKKNMEAPEIEREVKRLLRADNEAVSVTWEVITEEDDHSSKPDAAPVTSNKGKVKKESKVTKQLKNVNEESKVEDIFGGALSDSDNDDDLIDVVKNYTLPAGNDLLVNTDIAGPSNMKKTSTVTSQSIVGKSKLTGKKEKSHQTFTTKQTVETQQNTATYSNIKQQEHFELQQLVVELEELKLRRQRTQHEIAGLQNVTLRQRFQDILLTLNREINLKEKAYKNLKASIQFHN